MLLVTAFRVDVVMVQSREMSMTVARHPGTGKWCVRSSCPDSGWLVSVLCVALVVVLGMGIVAIQRHQAPASSVRTAKGSTPRVGGQRPKNSVSAPQGAADPPVPLGVYAGPGSPSSATAFADAIGSRTPYALDYLDDTSWQTISDPAWFLQRWSGSGFRMIWAIPMLPGTGGSMADGAAGDYNVDFATLAQNLIANGQESAILMPGWDPDASGSTWSVSTSAQASTYISFFQRIVSTMRAVPGARFQFAWDASGDCVIPPAAVYPGSSFVDSIATDAFDRGLGTVEGRWAAISQSTYGLDWFASFAAQQHKPLMLARWGLAPVAASGGGDDPIFVDDLLSWARQEHVIAAVTWDYGLWAVTGGNFPRAAAELRQVAAGASDPSHSAT